MRSMLLTAALMLACGAASAQTTPGEDSWTDGRHSIASCCVSLDHYQHTTIGSNVWGGGEATVAIGTSAPPQPPAWVLERWTRDITRISEELVASAERLPQCSSLQAKQQLQRARLMAESMRKTDRTSMGAFSDATLRMTSVVNNVRLALDACN